eukprot:1160660-Pelagomonas_calceolata.AAC.8
MSMKGRRRKDIIARLQGVMNKKLKLQMHLPCAPKASLLMSHMLPASEILGVSRLRWLPERTACQFQRATDLCTSQPQHVYEDPPALHSFCERFQLSSFN